MSNFTVIPLDNNKYINIDYHINTDGNSIHVVEIYTSDGEKLINCIEEVQRDILCDLGFDIDALHNFSWYYYILNGLTYSHDLTANRLVYIPSTDSLILDSLEYLIKYRQTSYFGYSLHDLNNVDTGVIKCVLGALDYPDGTNTNGECSVLFIVENTGFSVENVKSSLDNLVQYKILNKLNLSGYEFYTASENTRILFGYEV
ncbi:hypothetical protein ABGV42_01565 [Paenibacillus pabuli]|uniref:hypothetical protein n=1 Tax=Paenibacillus pabuli TaxID=1472 RepID=UPI003242FA1A